MTFARDLASFADSATQNLTFRNKIINGGFDIWQRGTSFTNPTSSSTTYTTDRWILGFANANPTSASITQQSFTPGNPITGYEPTFFARSTITTVGSTTTYRPFTQRIEDVRTFAGQTVTLSFWAKADSARTLTTNFQQVFGTGGSSSVGGSGQSHTLSTSWNRYTHSFGVTSISGKTIGTNSYLEIIFQQAAASGSVLDIWGVQVEAGPAATPFEIRPIGTEFALCQRYYTRFTGNANARFSNATPYTTTNAICSIHLPTTMRTTPTALDFSSIQIETPGVGTHAISAASLDGPTANLGCINVTTTGMTQWRPLLLNLVSGTSFIGFSAEL
jgi:hypothetical protein